MEPFTIHKGTLALLEWTDVNTDLIIPARYLKRIERTGYGQLLFADKRYKPGGEPAADDPDKHGELNPDFPLNQLKYKGASILVVGRNFGCGSSREHAVWAVAQASYRVLIAPGKGEGFADIFEGNAYNNGLLPIELDEKDWSKIVKTLQSDHPIHAEVNLHETTLTINPFDNEFSIKFEIPEAQRHRLLHGLDAVSETLLLESAISKYERETQAWLTARST